MVVVVGLGNPGEQYHDTRHNIGFMVLDQLASRIGVQLKKKGYSGLYSLGRLSGKEVCLLQPQTFMNLSGESVTAAVKGLKVGIESIIVIHDDLDMPLGRVKIKVGGGHGGHNGIRDISAKLGKEFIRVKVGIDRPHAESNNVTGHVLGRFSRDERILLPEIIDRVVDGVEDIVSSGVLAAMNSFNSVDSCS